jgi:hypothetical protein
MAVISLALMLVAFVLFVLAALSVAVPRVNLIGAGLAFWVLSVLLGHFIPA